MDQYRRLDEFIPESFFSIALSLSSQNQVVPFAWSRGRLFDEEVVQMIYSLVQDSDVEVVRVGKKETQKWSVLLATVFGFKANAQNRKPLPLTTVELQKSGSRLLHLTPKQILDVGPSPAALQILTGIQISDSLYQKGFLSYPRTETDQFDDEFDFTEVIRKQVDDRNWGPFAQSYVSQPFILTDTHPQPHRWRLLCPSERSQQR